ncbi:hypothetical protein Tco_0583681 [Tanacetum coccineum]
MRFRKSRLTFLIRGGNLIFHYARDNIMRRCVARSETLEILAHYHSGPTNGHHSANVTANKVYESGFYWPSIIKDANEFMYPRKLKSKWNGPNVVKTVYPHGAIEITDRDGVSYGQRLQKYYGGNIDKEDDEVIEFENGVT